MKSICLISLAALGCAWGQVHQTPGALPSGVAAAPAPAGSITKPLAGREAFKRLERDFDYSLKTADKDSPMDVLGYTRGVYLPGYGVVFSTEVELALNNILPMFHPGAVTSEEKARMHNRKVQHLDLLRKQMHDMLVASSNTLDLSPTDQIVVAVRLAYQTWEDRSGLPDQIVMRSDKRGLQTGDIKVDVQ